MTENVIPLGREELSEFDKQLVEKSVRIEIPLRDASRVEIRAMLGYVIRLAQEASAQTHEEPNERTMRLKVWASLRDAQLRIIDYRRKARQRSRRDAEGRLG